MSPDNMIWYHGDIPSDLWVMGDKLMKVGLPNAAKSQPVSVDPTFNFGDYEVTPFAYRHPLIESRSKNIPDQWTNAVMIGPTVIHRNKEYSTYKRAFLVVEVETKLGKNPFLLITDGEESLYTAAMTVFKGMSHGRCTIHYKQNCKAFLKGDWYN